MNLLLVEDNDGDRRLFEEYATAAGIERSDIMAARTIDEAVKLAASVEFAAAFVDLGLPDATGLGALVALRTAAPHLPIIVLTGRDEEQLSLDALEQGAQDYIPKDSLRSNRLRQCLAFAIQRKRVDDDLRRRDQGAHQAQKLEAIGQLAAGIAHEINTPMQYIGDNLLFLQDAIAELDPVLRRLTAIPCAGNARDLSELVQMAGQADLDYLLAEIPNALGQSMDGVTRVSKIVRAMKEFSHPGTTEKQLTDVGQLVESTVTVCRNEWKYVACLETDVPADLPAVPCLPGDISQVLLNLVVNAAHAIADRKASCPELHGLIRVSARAVDEVVELSVSDNGSGIPDRARAKVFEPFFTTKEVGKGTGQGLSFAYATIVEKHGGTMAFDTEVGAGTTFYLRIPARVEPSPKPCRHE